MPIEYAFHDAFNCLLVRITGAVTEADFSGAAARVSSDPRIEAGHIRFTDLRMVRELPSAAELEGIAWRISELGRRKSALRSAILVGTDHHFGMARLFQAHRGVDQDTISVFREYDEAARWLGLPTDGPDLFGEVDVWS